MTKKLITLFVLLLLSCSSGSRSGDEVVIALDSEPKRINPLFLTDLNSHMISNLIFRGLISIDNDGKPKPELAESWQIKDGGKKIIFNLRKDVYWHDGIPFSAQDVLFTLKLLESNEIASPIKGSLGPVKDIKIIDSHTVSIDYSEPYGSALESLKVGILPQHLGNRVLESSFDSSPVGTGPWKVQKWQRGQFIILERFDKFYGEVSKIKKVQIRFIPDQTTKYLELKSGRIDAAEFQAHTEVKDLENKFNKYQADSYRYVCLGFNLEKFPFKSSEFRIAVAKMINKEELIKGVLKGNGKISLGPYPRGTWYYDSEIKPYEYNPKEANQILKKLDMSDIKFKIFVASENKELQQVAQFIQQSLKEGGIQTEIRLFDWQTLRHRILEEKNYDAVILSRTYLWDPDIYDLWHSSKAKGGWNLFSFSDREIDRLLERGRKTLDFHRRAEIYKRVQRILYEKQACVFLYETPLTFYASKRIKNIEPSPQGFLYRLEKWTLID